MAHRLHAARSEERERGKSGTTKHRRGAAAGAPRRACLALAARHCADTMATSGQSFSDPSDYCSCARLVPCEHTAFCQQATHAFFRRPFFLSISQAVTVIATQLVRHTLTIAYAYHPGLPFADRGFSGDDDFVAQAISSEHLPQSRPFCASACDAFCLLGPA